MVVDKYLKALALANRRIIIPNLGAFLSKEGDGDGKNLIFSSFLKYNDGFLEGYIAEKEKVSAPDSAKMVGEFVDEVGKTIRAGRRYEVEDFGYFYMDERGGVAFMSKGAEATEASTPTPVVEAAAPVTQQVAATPPPTPVTVEPVVPQMPPASPPPNRPTPIRPATREPEPKKGGNNGLLITIIVLLIIIILLIASYFLIPEVKQRVDAMFSKSSTTAVVDTPISEPVNTQDTTSVQQTVQPVEDTHTQTTAPTNTNTNPKVNAAPATTSAMDGNAYYVIVGTFREKANADKMYQKCLADGYDAELLPMMGPLYPVAIFKSTTKSEAYNKWLEARKKYGDSWIFKSRR